MRNAQRDMYFINVLNFLIFMQELNPKNTVLPMPHPHLVAMAVPGLE